MAATKKQFEVLDGLSVDGIVDVSGNVAIDTNVLFVNTDTNRVGVLKSPTQGALDVNGTVFATAFNGDGSSLTSVDAATVDGIDSASFLRSDADTTFGSGATKTLSIDSAARLRVVDGKIHVDDDQFIQFGNISVPDLSIRWQGSNNYLSFAGGDINVKNLTGSNNTPVLYADVSAGKVTVNRVLDEINDYKLDVGGDVRINGDIVATGDVTAYSSDRNLKTNLRVIPNALEKMEHINGYEFDWDIDKCKEVGFSPKNIHEHGVIAQEIEKVMPDLVVESAFDEDYKSVKYDRIVSLLIAAIKELKQEIDLLKK